MSGKCSILKGIKLITEQAFIDMALSLNGTETTPHFERTGFRVIGKRMFASYLQKNNTANIFLSLEEQKLFCELDEKHIYPVPNKWGEKGITTFELDHVKKEFVMEALLSAYNEVIQYKKKK